MILLTKDLKLYDTEFFGSDTWGDTTQEGIISKYKNWYISYWRDGDDEYTEDIKLDVIKEFENVDQCAGYLEGLVRQLKSIFDNQNHWTESSINQINYRLEELKKKRR